MPSSCTARCVGEFCKYVQVRLEVRTVHPGRSEAALQYFVCGAALLGAVLRTALCVPCRTALVGSGQWAVELLQCTATLPGGSGLWNSCNALPHRLAAVGSGTPVMHRHTAWGQWAVQLLQCTATPPGGGGQWNSCNARAHQLGGTGMPAQEAVTALRAELLQCTATLPGRRRRRRRSACRGPTYGEPWRRPSGAPRRLCRGSPPSYLR